jgi:parallel beta-helix repeat protein
VTCPAGAVDIRPGVSIQSIVNLYPGATTFCLRAGVHFIAASITPRSGNTFVGEYGAILDGTGWTTSDLTQAAFRAHSEDINDVTIRNLVIRHMPQRGIHAYSSGLCDVVAHICRFSTAGADRWTIEHNEIAYNVEGINAPTDGIIRHNYIHHNVGPDPFGTNGRTRGGGFESYLAQRVLFEHNEISYNGQEMKAASLSPNTIFRNNFVHHNLGNGIWFDGENPGSLIENNIVEDNAGQGIFYEVSGQGVIRNNTVRRSGGNGIFIATSHSVEIYGNTLEDNFRGINYFVDCSAVGAPSGGEIGEEIYMQDVSAHDNTITVGTQSGAWAGALSYTACTSTQLAPYLNGSKNLTFTNNTYTVPDVSAGWWVWGDSFKTWNQWQALGRDVSGVIARRR